MKARHIAASALLLASMTLLGGCSTPKKVAYFQDTTDLVNIMTNNPIKVKPDDKLSIVVNTKDAAVSNLFNLGVYTTRYGAGGSTLNSARSTHGYQPSGTEGLATYTVDPAGYIDFPVLGKLKVEGMTRSELAGFIKGELMGRDLVKDPTVIVEFVNTGINLLGEVARPGRYDLNTDNLNVIEAISLAGDLTLSGMRDRVKVLREENGQIKIYTLDLTNLTELAKSPAFMMQQNDIVYVEPNDVRKRATTINGNNMLSTSFWISVASLIATAVTSVGIYVQK